MTVIRHLGEDRGWIGVMAALTAVELAWWAVGWSLGIAPAPRLATYLAAACGGLAAALVIRFVARPSTPRAGWPAMVAGAALVAIAASLFLPLKYAIPSQMPFWLDGPLAAAERTLFNGDLWRPLNRALGWALMPVDRIYGLWLPVQSLTLFTVMVAPASRAKSRALIAYGLAWFVLGVAAATIFSSAGPIFYDRLFGGGDFASLRDTLRAGGAWVVLAESDAMWAALANRDPGLVAGISAFPSLHVAISLWMLLAARTMAPRLASLAMLYTGFIWLASVQLGWHYAADGLAGAAGMLAIWWVAGKVESRLSALGPAEAVPRPRGADAEEVR